MLGSLCPLQCLKDYTISGGKKQGQPCMQSMPHNRCITSLALSDLEAEVLVATNVYKCDIWVTNGPQKYESFTSHDLFNLRITAGTRILKPWSPNYSAGLCDQRTSFLFQTLNNEPQLPPRFLWSKYSNHHQVLTTINSPAIAQRHFTSLWCHSYAHLAAIDPLKHKIDKLWSRANYETKE